MSAASSARQQDVTLNELVDLALCSPEIGAVNFNILRLVLHELVKIVGNGREILPALGDMDKSQVQNFKNYIMGAGTQTPPIGVLRIAQQPTVFIPGQTPRTGRNPNPQGVNQPVYVQPVQASPPIIPQGQGAVQQSGFPQQQQQPFRNQQGAVQQAGFPQQQPSENQQGAVQQAGFPQQQPSGNQQGAVRQAKVTNQTQRGPGQQGGGGGKQVQPPTQGQVQPGAPQSHSQAALQPQSQGAVQPTASQPQIQVQVQPQKLGAIQQGQPQPQRSTGQPEQGQVQQAPIVQQQLTDILNPPAPIQQIGQIQQGPVLVPAQDQVNQQAAPMAYQPEGPVMYSQPHYMPPGAPPAAYTQQGQSYSQPGQPQYIQPVSPQVTYTQQRQPVYVGANGYPMNYSPYMQQGAVMPHDQELEAKVTRLERQLEALYALPTNSTILRRVSRDPDEPEGEAPHSTSEAAEGSGMAVHDMWQVIQLNNRVAGCEAAIQKMASLIEDLAKQLRSSKRRSMDTGSDTEGGIYERCDEAQRAVEVLRGEIDEIKKGTVQAVSKMGLQQPSKTPGQASSQASQAQVGPEQLGRMQARLGASEGAIRKMANLVEELAKEMKTLKESQVGEQTIGTVKTKCEEVTKAVETIKTDFDKIKQKWKEEFDKLIQAHKGGHGQVPQQPIGSKQVLQVGQGPLIPTKHVVPGRPIPGSAAASTQASRTQNQVPVPLLPVRHTPSEEMLLKKERAVVPLTDLAQLRERLRAEGRIPAEFDETEVLEKLATLWEAAELMRRNQEAMLMRLLKLDNSIQKLPQEHLEALGQVPVVRIETLASLAESKAPLPLESLLNVTQSTATAAGRRKTDLTKRALAGFFEADSDDVHTIFENLNNLVSESIEQKERLEAMYDLCRHLETIMVTKEVLADALLDKADKGAMNTKVSYDEFGNSVEELTNKLQNLLVEVYQKNEGWKRITDRIIEDLGDKLNKDELGPLRAYFKSHMDNLDKQVEELVRQMNEPDPAGTRKKILRDYNCISCDRHTNISGKTNAPTLPCIGPVSAGHTTASRRAFDLYNMRNNAKGFGFDPNYCNFNAIEKTIGSRFRSDVNLITEGQQSFESGCTYTVNRYVGGSHTIVSTANRVSAFAKRPGTVLPPYCEAKDLSGIPEGLAGNLSHHQDVAKAMGIQVVEPAVKRGSHIHSQPAAKPQPAAYVMDFEE